ncbi:MAG: hypothetical protein JRJ65_11680 [Deltaproteobacteria bacterium]|nr:hypothetical protein [Deltaproteobacteria bacterium]
MGVRFAIDVFEGAIGFTIESQIELIERFRESIALKEKLNKPAKGPSFDFNLFKPQLPSPPPAGFSRSRTRVP